MGRGGAPAAQLIALGIVALVVLGCGILQATPSRSVVRTGPDGMRTFTVFREIDGRPVLCTLGAPLDPVTGTLRGDRQNPGEPVWLEQANGRRLSVVWPDGFTLLFDPQPRPSR
jgi:hypothetical protein